MTALESQANQSRVQAAQEAERLGKEKNATLQLLQKVTGTGANLGRWQL